MRLIELRTQISKIDKDMMELLSNAWKYQDILVYIKRTSLTNF